MKIAFIFDALLYGGIERVGISYLKFLHEKGYDVDVFVLNPKDIEGIIEEIPSKFSIYKIRVSPYLCPARYWYIAKRWWWGKYVLPIIHPIIYTLLIVYGAQFKLKGKYDLAISMAGHFNDLSVNAYNLVRSAKKLAWLHGALYEYMIISPGFERLYMKIQNLITLNDFGENGCLFFNKFLKLNLKKIYNPCFISERRLEKDIIASLKDKYGDFILMTARLTPPKNPLGVIRALEYIKDKYNKTYNFVIVGDGEDRDKIQDYLKNSPIGSCVFLEGTQKDPQNYYAAARLFAFSSYSEGLPTVLIEAITFGLPIATSDTSVREILRDGKDGFISPIDDDAALGEDIYRLMENDDIWNSYHEKSLLRSKAFAPDTIKKQFFEYLEKLW